MACCQLCEVSENRPGHRSLLGDCPPRTCSSPSLGFLPAGLVRWHRGQRMYLSLPYRAEKVGCWSPFLTWLARRVVFTRGICSHWWVPWEELEVTNACIRGLGLISLPSHSFSFTNSFKTRSRVFMVPVPMQELGALVICVLLPAVGVPLSPLQSTLRAAEGLGC